MNQKEKIRSFKIIYSEKIIGLDKNLMPITRGLMKPGIPKPKGKILKEPECRTALAIMIQEFGSLYIPEEK